MDRIRGKGRAEGEGKRTEPRAWAKGGKRACDSPGAVGGVSKKTRRDNKPEKLRLSLGGS